MSIASRVTSIEEHIGNAYKKIDDLGIDSSNVDKNIDNIASLLDTVYEDYPKVPGQGTEVTLDGTKVGKLELNEKGNSTQETTNGYQLYDVTDLKSKTNNVSIDKDGWITVSEVDNTEGSSTLYQSVVTKPKSYITENSKTYYGVIEIKKVSGTGRLDPYTSNSPNQKAQIVKTDAKYSFASRTAGEVIITQLSSNSDLTDTNVFMRTILQWQAGQKGSITFRISVWETEPTLENFVYEKFTGGQASPNPSYPQEIYSAGDDINLFDKNNIVNDYYLSNEGVATYNNVWAISNYMTVYKSITYQGLNDVGNAPYSCWYDENKKFLSSFKQHTGENTINVPENAKYVRFSVRKTGIDDFIVKNNVGIINEKIANKNFFDVNMIQERTHNGITLTFDGQTINLKGTATGNANFYRKSGYTIILPAGTYYVQRSSLLNIGTLKLVSGSTTILDTGNTDTTITLNNDTIIDGLILQVPSAVGTIDEDVVIMICRNDLDTTYTPHQEQTYTIPVQQPMRSIGTVRDEFIQDEEGNWYERHNIGYIEVDGTGEVAKGSDGTYTRYELRGIIPLMKQNASRTEILSNYFHYLSSGREVGLCFSYWIYSGTIFIYPEQTITTADDMKAWLNTNKPKFCYLLETPQDLPCTEEQIAILENLPKSYNEQTNIYSLDVTPAYLEAKALKDLSNLTN